MDAITKMIVKEALDTFCDNVDMAYEVEKDFGDDMMGLYLERAWLEFNQDILKLGLPRETIVSVMRYAYHMI